MDRDSLLELLTIDDIRGIVMSLGSDYPKKDAQGNLYFQTACHGGDKHKLHLFTETKMFMCYTSCGSMSIYDVVMNSMNCDFHEAFKYIANVKGVDLYTQNRKVGLITKETKNEDMLFLKKHLYKPNKKESKLPIYDESVMKIFDDYYPDVWHKEGIEDDIAKYFNIKFYFNQYKAIIPHYDVNGGLVGVRGRNFFEKEIKDGKKYMPITIQGLTYRYPMNFNLYGLYQNKNNIRRIKKAIIFEGEKSVLKYGSYYNQNNNIALATSGMNLSTYQRDLILKQGVKEIIICFDKQYEIEKIQDENSKEYADYVKYVKKIMKISDMLFDYCSVSVVMCFDNRLDYKDAPIDKGRNIFEELLKERVVVESIEDLEEII